MKRKNLPEFERFCANAATPEVLFEMCNGRPVPRLLRDTDGTMRHADGVKYIDAQDAAERLGISPDDAEELWLATWSDLLDRNFKIIYRGGKAGA